VFGAVVRPCHETQGPKFHSQENAVDPGNVILSAPTKGWPRGRSRLQMGPRVFAGALTELFGPVAQRLGGRDLILPWFGGFDCPPGSHPPPCGALPNDKVCPRWARLGFRFVIFAMECSLTHSLSPSKYDFVGHRGWAARAFAAGPRNGGPPSLGWDHVVISEGGRESGRGLCMSAGCFARAKSVIESATSMLTLQAPRREISGLRAENIREWTLSGNPWARANGARGPSCRLSQRAS